jgi:arylsulfatase A-like enzyme
MSSIKRVTLVLLTIVAGMSLSQSCRAREPDAETSSPPNFVIIFCDDLGYGDLGCFGHPTIHTPHLDRMAAEGLRFTQFYASAPVCTPSRAGLLTGRYAIRSGLCSDQRRVLFPDSTGGLPEDEITIAEALKSRGYATACIGKWHLGHLPEYLPTRHGFDHYFGIPYSNDMQPNAVRRKWPPLPLLRDTEVIEEEPDQRLLTERYTSESIQFLKDIAAQGDDAPPFFLYLPHTMPHTPLFASERFSGHSHRGLYGDVVETIDWSTGEILRTLSELGFAENTLVVFTSDNGPWRTQGPRGGSAGLLRGGKGSTWEGGMREPAIAWWPSRIKPGVTTGLGSTLDLFPTLLALAEVREPADRPLDGYDLSPLLLKGQASPRNTFFYYRDAEATAVRRGPWKLHVKTQAGYGQPKPDIHDPPLLYHLEQDPSEEYNVAAQHMDIVAELESLLQKHVAETTPGKPQL